MTEPTPPKQAPSPLIRRTVLFGLLLLSLVLSLHLGLRSRWQYARGDAPDRGPGYLPSAQVVDTVSLGYRTFVSDLLWVRCLQFYDGRTMRYIGPKMLEPYIDAMLTLDPDFRSGYRWAGLAPMLTSSKATLDNIKQANHYLEKAMLRYPDEYYWPYTIGLNYAFWTPVGEQKDEMMVLGARYLQKALPLEGAPPTLPTLIAKLLSVQENQSEMVNFLEQAYLNASNPQLRQQLERRLRSIDSSSRRRQIHQRQQTRARWWEDNYPYLPPGLFYQVGARQRFNPTASLVSIPNEP